MSWKYINPGYAELINNPKTKVESKFNKTMFPFLGTYYIYRYIYIPSEGILGLHQIKTPEGTKQLYGRFTMYNDFVYDHRCYNYDGGLNGLYESSKNLPINLTFISKLNNSKNICFYIYKNQIEYRPNLNLDNHKTYTYWSINSVPYKEIHFFIKSDQEHGELQIYINYQLIIDFKDVNILDGDDIDIDSITNVNCYRTELYNGINDYYGQIDVRDGKVEAETEYPTPYNKIGISDIVITTDKTNIFNEHATLIPLTSDDQNNWSSDSDSYSTSTLNSNLILKPDISKIEPDDEKKYISIGCRIKNNEITRKNLTDFSDINIQMDYETETKISKTFKNTFDGNFVNYNYSADFENQLNINDLEKVKFKINIEKNIETPEEGG